MPIFRPLLAFGISLAIAGCAPAPLPPAPQFLPATLQPSTRAEVAFAYLSLEGAMRGDNPTAVLDAANLLLRSEPSSRPLADAAGWLLANRHTQEATALLEAAVKALPSDLPLHIMLSETMLEEGDLDGAIDLLKQFTANHNTDGAAKVEMALLFLKAEKYQDSLAYFDAIPTAERTPSVHYYHAQALRATGQLSLAATVLRTALTDAPDFLEAMLELALVEEQRQRYSEARQLYEKLLKYDDGNQDILLRLVIVSLKQGNAQRAFTIANSVPDSLGFSLTAASLFMEEGRYDLAGILLDMMAKQPNAPEELAFYRAAISYEGEKNNPKTLKLLSQVSSTNRFYDKALRLRMQVYYSQGLLNDALAVAHEATEAFPNDLELRYAEMELLVALNRLPQAIKKAENALQEWSEDPDLAFQHAWYFDLSGDKQQAMRLMEAILARHPDNAAAMNYIGYTLADENRDLERALQLLNKAVELSPDTDYMLDSLAWAQYRLAMYPQAWETIRHATSLSPGKDAVMWDHYGDIAKAAGHPAEARQGWTKALEIDPADTAVRAKLEKL